MTGSQASQEDAGQLLASILTGGSVGDLYAVYDRIREQAPVLCTGNGTVVLSRFGDAWNALRHPDLGKPEQGFAIRSGEVSDEQIGLAMDRWRHTILFANPPEHTRLRRLISDVFTPRHVEQLRATISATADRYLDRLDGHTTTNFIAAVAQPMPAKVIADLLGIPSADHEAFAPLIRDLVDLFEPSATADTVTRAIAAQDEIGGYFAGLIEDKRRHPRADLLSRLAASHAADALDNTEMIASAVLLFAAGFETTVNLIGNGLHALLTHPAELSLLRQEPRLVPRAVEEFLRWDAPVQLTSRAAMRPCSIAGVPISPGQTVLVLLGAANRDPARFTSPGELMVTREEGPVLSFGTGSHFCLGAHLARLETSEVFTRLLQRFAHFELAGSPRRRPSRSLRGFAELPVAARR